MGGVRDEECKADLPTPASIQSAYQNGGGHDERQRDVAVRTSQPAASLQALLAALQAIRGTPVPQASVRSDGAVILPIIPTLPPMPARPMDPLGAALYDNLGVRRSPRSRADEAPDLDA